MPARNEFGNKTKKKKGRAPAHQNKFGFQHNPCSKKTEKILALKNVNICQRCSDKIEWRKKYRKYKPRTQPGICNECKKRNVSSAYHTICTKCSAESVKAKELIKEAAGLELRSCGSARAQQQQPVRACAICVKEIALPDPEWEEDKSDHVEAMSRLKLRERRAIERKLAKEEEPEKGDKDDGSDDNKNGDQTHESSLDPLAEEHAADGDSIPDYGSDEDDPFLKAIGGADKLVTGEAYRQKLSQQQAV
mmetsp:Transcript_516/g.1197  ORF Transcript_516/g.1197 Transcript_516/m.1197 type:complete len:249 (-) Transcript_516:1118-1864(-)